MLMPKNIATIIDKTASANNKWHATPYASAVAMRAGPGGGRNVEKASLINRISGGFSSMHNICFKCGAFQGRHAIRRKRATGQPSKMEPNTGLGRCVANQSGVWSCVSHLLRFVINRCSPKKTMIFLRFKCHSVYQTSKRVPSANKTIHKVFGLVMCLWRQPLINWSVFAANLKSSA